MFSPVKRLRETCPVYVDTAGEARKGTDASKRLVIFLEHLARCIAPNQLEDNPSPEDLARVNEHARNGVFGRLSTLQRLTQTFQPLPVHPLLLDALLLVPEEAPDPELALVRSFCAAHGWTQPHAEAFRHARALYRRPDTLLDAARFCLPGGRFSTTRFALVVTRKDQEEAALQHAIQSQTSVCHPNPKPKLPQWSDWHQEVHDAALQRAGQTHRTAFPTEYLRTWSARIRRFLRDVDRETGCAKTFFKEADLTGWRGLLRTILCFRRAVRNERVRTTLHVHHARGAAAVCLRVIKHLLREHIAAPVQNLAVAEILRDVPNRRVPAKEARKVLTEEQVQRMRELARDPAEVLLLALLEEVALRNSALGHLQLHMLADPVTFTPRSLWAVPEKGNRLRTFRASERVQRAAQDLIRWHLAHRSSLDAASYVLNLGNVTQRLSSSTVRLKVQRLAREAGVEHHAHPHLFRHALVTRLMAAGNRIETVARFMGHANVAVTSSAYWLPGVEDLEKSMINPFAPEYHRAAMQTEERDAQLEAEREKVRACRRLIDRMVPLIDRQVLNRALPRLFDILHIVDEGNQG